MQSFETPANPPPPPLLGKSRDDHLIFTSLCFFWEGVGGGGEGELHCLIFRRLEVI